MTFPNPTPLGLGNGFHVPAATAAAATATVRAHVPDDGTADLVLNMLGLRDDYETDRQRGREHGTPAGYRQHQRTKDRACQPCLTAWRTYNRGFYTPKEAP